MFPYILFLFISVPILEIYLLLAVGEQIGVFATVSLIIFTAILGTAMLRVQGTATLQKLQQQLAAHEMPAQALLEGLILLVGGVLLLTPGFFTDALGFLCLLPWTRQWGAAYFIQRSLARAASAQAQYTQRPSGPPRQPNVMEGEYKREDD